MPQHVAWQKDVWDRMAKVYVDGAEPRFVGVVLGAIRRAALQRGERVLDLGCGSGAATMAAAQQVGERGRVTGIDLSEEMLRLAGKRAEEQGIEIELHAGRAEEIPAESGSQDVVLASLSLMFVLDKPAAAREIARVLKPGGRFVAACWAPAEECDIVRLQRTAGAHAPEPPVKGVGPASMANPEPFLALLAANGVAAHVERETVTWQHPSLQDALDTFLPVTASRMTEEQLRACKEELLRTMWGGKDGERTLVNGVIYLVGEKQFVIGNL